MTDDLRQRLEASIGDTYRIERELGGGGMSRVFLAEETKLGRRVVIKVLPPEMGAGVNADRFEREVRLAAKLQHPHIVPLLTAGAVGDLLYYVMPYVDGESLRARLAREGELPVGEAVRILRDVVDALQHAHEQRVIHRDIKPDNILLSGKHALVTDFGIAKAVSESSGTSLTSLGVALGTPAYMAPEQAAAEPNVDHRADIYALGAMAYEMLAGRPPFTGGSVQAVLAAHMTQAPDPVTIHRETVPPVLSDLVMRCLHKKAADRWQGVMDLQPHLEALLTPSGGMTPVGTAPVASRDHAAAVRRAHPARVAVAYGAISVVMLAVAYGMTMWLGLPAWVTVATGMLLVVGLPIAITSGHRDRRRAMAAMTGLSTQTPVGLERHLTIPRVRQYGALALAGLVVAVAGYMAMRLLGIGPVGTLAARGLLDDQQRLVLAEFENATDDSTLAETVTELLRIDLAQSPTITVLEPGQLATVLALMKRDTAAVVTPGLAREIAEREGIKAYVTGEVRGVGDGYVLTVRVLATAGGEALLTARSEARDDATLVAAVDRLSATVRARIGESLRSVRADPPLESVTTSSIDALRKYAQALVIGRDGEYGRAIGVMEEAIRLDPEFAMAYRKMAAWLGNVGRRERADSAITKAYEYRDRLTEVERYMVEALYANFIEGDAAKEQDLYRTLLDKYPNHSVALNNLGVGLQWQGRWIEAEEFLRRAIAAGGATSQTYANFASALALLDRLGEADSVLAVADNLFPGASPLVSVRRQVAAAQGDFEEAVRVTLALREEQRGRLRWERLTASWLGDLAQVRGQLDEARRWRAAEAERSDSSEPNHSAMEADSARGVLWSDVLYGVYWLGFDSSATVAQIDAVRRRYPPGTAGDSLFYGILYRTVGASMQGRALGARLEEGGPIRARLRVAMAEGAGAEASRLARLQREEYPGCLPCGLWEAGYAWEAAGEPDSALAYYGRFVAIPRVTQVNQALPLPIVLRRLGALYAARGDRERAIEYYTRFVDLWRDADPEFQPFVEEARAQLAALTAEPR